MKIFIEKNGLDKQALFRELETLVLKFSQDNIEITESDYVTFVKYKDELNSYFFDKEKNTTLFNVFFEQQGQRIKIKKDKIESLIIAIDYLLKTNATKIFKLARQHDDKANSQIMDFLQKRDDYNYFGKYTETALHWAAYYGNLTLANFLIEKGADIDVQDEENQRTPLMWAILRLLHNEKKYFQVIKFFHEKKLILHCEIILEKMRLIY